MDNKASHLASCHAHLRGIYTCYPLTMLLVESAGRLEQVPGHNFSSVHIAYKDWLRAIFVREDRSFREVLWVIDQLIPPNQHEGSVYQFNPALPGLPPRPALRETHRQQRYEAMQRTLDVLFHLAEVDTWIESDR